MAVATSIASMEFDVRVIEARSGALVAAGQPAVKPPAAIQVRQRDLDVLRTHLLDLIEEQQEFDALFAVRCAKRRVQHLCLISVAAVVAAVMAAIAIFDRNLPRTAPLRPAPDAALVR